MMATADSPRLDALRREYGDRLRKADAASRYKYLDVAYYTFLKLLLARDLGLTKGPPRRVLDIGTGGGHFPFVCRFFGHRALGIDIENPVYESIAACLGIRRTIVRIEPRKPLPELGGRFDVITACGVSFNKLGEQDDRRLYWSLEEWQFFLDDLVANQLQRPGLLYFALNKEARGRLLGFHRYAYNREVLGLAARRGAVVSRRHGTIKLALA